MMVSLPEPLRQRERGRVCGRKRGKNGDTEIDG